MLDLAYHLKTFIVIATSIFHWDVHTHIASNYIKGTFYEIIATLILIYHTNTMLKQAIIAQLINTIKCESGQDLIIFNQ